MEAAELTSDERLDAFVATFGLTERERDILEVLVVSDQSVQDIATTLFLSRSTLYRHISSINKKAPDINVVEMDCVEGKKGESKAILTFTFRNCNLMLMFLLEYQDQECVLEVFVWLETVLGQEAFK